MRPWLPWVVAAGLATAVPVGVLAIGDRPQLAFDGTALPPTQAPDFVLVDHAGQPSRLRDWQGDVVLVTFGFTSCPMICPVTMQRIDAAVKEVGADDVRVLLITVDPENDTPERLASFLSPHGERFVGLTGDPDVLAQVRQAYGVHAARVGPEAADLEHGGAVFGIDRDGQLRVVSTASPDADLAADLRALRAL